MQDMTLGQNLAGHFGIVSVTFAHPAPNGTEETSSCRAGVSEPGPKSFSPALDSLRKRQCLMRRLYRSCLGVVGAMIAFNLVSAGIVYAVVSGHFVVDPICFSYEFVSSFVLKLKVRLRWCIWSAGRTCDLQANLSKRKEIQLAARALKKHQRHCSEVFCSDVFISLVWPPTGSSRGRRSI